MFPVCCNAPCKAQEYGVMPHVRHLCAVASSNILQVYVLLVMPHVRHVCVLLPLVR